jgi:hypothetical protein
MQRERQPDVEILSVKDARQRPGHIGEPADLDEGRGFRGEEQNFLWFDHALC